MNTPTRKTEKTSKDIDNNKSFSRMLSEEDMAKISAERPSKIFTADDGRVAFNGRIYKDREELDTRLTAIEHWIKITYFLSFKWLWKRKKK